MMRNGSFVILSPSGFYFIGNIILKADRRGYYHLIIKMQMAQSLLFND